MTDDPRVPASGYSTPAGEVVLALAGHVDHGKSALVGALTGQRTDRRRAERERGLTVDLGHLVLAGDRPVAVTDVPGHVDYLGNTLVGLAGGTHVLLVVAADDGWMPQTEDHVRAARHLDVPVAAVAVSKIDLVDADRVRAVVDDVGRRLAAHGQHPPIVPVSAVAGIGLDELSDVLGQLTVSRPRGTVPRLWIDRAFHVEGRGLVVAGTLARGVLASGARVTVAPSGAVGRVRGLQQHGDPVSRVVGPGRVAVDLAEATADRGDRLVAGELGRRAPATTAVDAWLWGRHPGGIGARGAWLLHAGSATAEVEIRPVLHDAVGEGEDAPVHLRLSRSLPLAHGDRFVLRDVGRRLVAGGGLVLDPAPPGRARGRAARAARADVLDRLHAAPDAAGALVEADGGLTRADRVAAAVADPAPSVDLVDGHVISDAWRAQLAGRARAALADGGPDGRHVEAVVGQLARELSAPPGVVRALLDQLDGVVRRDTRVAPADRRRDLDEARRRALDELRRRLHAAPLAPEPLEDLARAAGVVPADLDRLVREGRVLRSGPYGFLPAVVDAVIARMRDLEAREGPFSVAQARDVLGISRKHAVPWMELLDRLGATWRQGDRRRVSPTAGSPRPGAAGTGR